MRCNCDYVHPDIGGKISEASVMPHIFAAENVCSVYDDAYILPYDDWKTGVGALCDSNGAIVPDHPDDEFVESAAPFDLGSAVIRDEDVINIGFLLNIFGHTFTENLSKLWFLESPQGKELVRSGARIVYTTAFNDPLSETALEFIRLAGFDISNAEHITEVTRFRKVYMPSNTFTTISGVKMYSPEYRLLIDRIRASIEAKTDSPSKIYFSRTLFRLAQPKREVGEKDIENVFRALGYEIVFPEKLPLKEQLQLAAGCTHFASTECSTSHVTMFCRPGTKVTLLMKADYINPHQQLINSLADLDVTYVTAHNSIRTNRKHPWWGPFYLYVTPYLCRFAGIPYRHLPLLLRRSFRRYLLRIKDLG